MKSAEENPPLYRVMRLNRPPAVGPSCGSSRGESSLCLPPSSAARDDEDNKTSLRCSGLPQKECAGSVAHAEERADPLHRVPQTIASGHGVDNFNSTQGFPPRGTPIFPRAVADHLKGGGALVTDSPHLLYAGRRAAPQGMCTAMTQHADIFRDPTLETQVRGHSDQPRRARLAMLRGNGSLW